MQVFLYPRLCMRETASNPNASFSRIPLQEHNYWILATVRTLLPPCCQHLARNSPTPLEPEQKAIKSDLSGVADAAQQHQFPNSCAPRCGPAPSWKAAGASSCRPNFTAAGDQPTAIAELTEGVSEGERDQVLLGATGTGKTFTMAKVIEETQRPAIILAPNKTLAAQLYGEFKGFFPDNAVEYFVSYYDYYQPEAYVAALRHLHREGKPDQRTDRPDAPLGHPRAAGTRRRDHRRLGVAASTASARSKPTAR